MKIKKVTGKRIKPMTACTYFAKNQKVWLALKEGKEITVPKEELEMVLNVFGDSVVQVKEIVKNKDDKKEMKDG